MSSSSPPLLIKEESISSGVDPSPMDLDETSSASGRMSEVVNQRNGENAAAAADDVHDSADLVDPQKILDEAKSAAKAFKSEFTLEPPCPEGPVSLARRAADGSTSLPFVYDAADRPDLSLHATLRRLPDGTIQLPHYVESPSHRIKPTSTFEFHTPFSTHLPDMCSYLSSVGVEESRELLSSGSDAVEDAEISRLLSSDHLHDPTLQTINFADSLLETLTQGEYIKMNLSDSEWMNGGGGGGGHGTSSESPIDGHGTMEEMAEEVEDTAQSTDPNRAAVVHDLKEATDLICELEKIQRKRLALSSIPIRPSLDEQQIADKVTDKLTHLISSHTRPVDVVSLEAVRRALGVKLDESTATTTTT